MRASSAPRRTFCPSAAVTCRIDPLTSARTRASFSAASVPEISGPVLMSCIVTATTFSGPTCTAAGAAGASGGGGSFLHAAVAARSVAQSAMVATLGNA